MKYKNSLKRSILFNLIFFSTIPLIIISILTLYFISNSIKEDINNKNHILLTDLKESVSQYLDIPLREILQIKEILNNKIISTKNINSYIKSIFTTNNYFNSLKISDKEGYIRYLVPYNEDFINIDVSQQDYFKLINNNDVYWSSTFISASSGHPTITLSCSSNDYVIIAELNLMFLYNFINHMKIGKKGNSFIVDENNVYIAHPNKTKVLQRNNLDYKLIETINGNKIISINNKKYFLNTILIKATNWKTGIIQPLEDVFRPINEAIIIIVFGTLGSLSIGIIIAFIRTQKILKPLEKLYTNSKEIINGNYTITFPKKSYYEIDELSNIFESMIATIKNREIELRENEERIKEILNNLPIAVGISTLEGKITFLNKKFINLFGYNLDDIPTIDDWSEQAYPDKNYRNTSSTIWTNDIKQSLDKKIIPPVRIYLIRTKKNETKNIELTFSLSNNSIIVSFIDITEKIKHNEQIKTSLREKETLLKEIHHRVKNNMQIIIGQRKIEDVESRNIFIESQNRIRAMAQVHEELYRSKDLSNINAKNLITNIVGNLFKTHYYFNRNVNYKNLTEDIYINIDYAIPCGLIINEIVSNSLKYAFVNMNEGEIIVELKKRENKYVLLISDNGIGLPEDFDYKTITSLGMRLIYNLSEQINGKIDMKTNNGLKYSIEFVVTH